MTNNRLVRDISDPKSVKPETGGASVIADVVDLDADVDKVGERDVDVVVEVGMLDVGVAEVNVDASEMEALPVVPMIVTAGG